MRIFTGRATTGCVVHPGFYSARIPTPVGLDDADKGVLLIRRLKSRTSLHEEPNPIETTQFTFFRWNIKCVGWNFMKVVSSNKLSKLFQEETGFKIHPSNSQIV